MAFEHELDALEAIGIEGQWSRLHGAYNAFLGRYLLHLAAEERAQEEILWPRFEERELAEASGRIQASLGPEWLSRDLEEFFPALNAEEIAGIVSLDERARARLCLRRGHADRSANGRAEPLGEGAGDAVLRT